MGTINYSTSDYITLGIKPYDYVDFENNAEFMEEMLQKVEEYGGTLEDEIYSYIDELYLCDYRNIECELKKYRFENFRVEIDSGYYEGFSIKIENNFCGYYTGNKWIDYFDSWEDRRDAQKGITEIKKFLKDCAGLGMVACYPGWRTGYCDYKETLKEISRAIKEMHQVVKDTPTWNQYYGQCA